LHAICSVNTRVAQTVLHAVPSPSGLEPRTIPAFGWRDSVPVPFYTPRSEAATFRVRSPAVGVTFSVRLCVTMKHAYNYRHVPRFPLLSVQCFLIRLGGKHRPVYHHHMMQAYARQWQQLRTTSHVIGPFYSGTALTRGAHTLLLCDAAHSGISSPTFRRNGLPPC
jgi:hypothetical protein